MKLFGYVFETKYIVIHSYRYLTQKWWKPNFVSYCTGFSFPNTGPANDPSRFHGGIYTASWDYVRSHAEKFEKAYAERVVSYYKEGITEDPDKSGYSWESYFAVPQIVMYKEIRINI